jgi:hypothetical protein
MSLVGIIRVNSAMSATCPVYQLSRRFRSAIVWPVHSVHAVHLAVQLSPSVLRLWGGRLRSACSD